MSCSRPDPRPVILRTVAVLVASCALAPRAGAQCDLLDFDGELAPDGSVHFGEALAASGDWLFVGDFANPDGIVGGGVVHAYQRGATGWVPRQLLTASDADEGDLFGTAVAFDGVRVLVGAPNDDDACGGTSGCQSGSAYVYELTPSGWVETQKLTAGDATYGQRFGYHVAIDGDIAVVGLSTYSNSVGAAYVFEHSAGVWTETTKLVESMPNEDFGRAVAVSGDTIAVGAARADGTFTGSGVVRVFQRAPSGWVQRFELTSQPQVYNGLFGSAVSLRGDRMLVGARGEGSGSQLGAAYFLRRDVVGWHHVVRVESGVGLFENYGWVVELGDELGIVASESTTYVYAPVGSIWQEIHSLVPPAVGGGFHATLTGRDVFFSNPSQSTPTAQGTVWTYTIPGATSYCISTPNSSGGSARISYEGCTGVGGNLFQLVAEPVPDGLGFFHYGPSRTFSTFGNGWLCVGPPTYALPIVATSGGALQFAVDFTSPPPGGVIVSGTTFYFQGVFRDGSALNTNTSDGLEVVFGP